MLLPLLVQIVALRAGPPLPPVTLTHCVRTSPQVRNVELHVLLLHLHIRAVLALLRRQLPAHLAPHQTRPNRRAGRRPLELSRWLKWSSLIGTAFVLIIILIDFGVLDYRQWDTVASAF